MANKSKGKSSAEIILTALENGTQLSIDLATVFLRTRYKGVLWMKKPNKIEGNWAEKYRKMQSFYTRLNQLKRDGLIEKRRIGSGNVWAITDNGQNWMVRRKTIGKSSIPAGSATTVIVSYDVPEESSSERRWLRETLKLMEFSMVHRSVWTGRGPLPADFFKVLREKELVDCVHIFEVDKKGTLKKLFD